MGTIMLSLHNKGRKLKGHIYSSTVQSFYAIFRKCVDPVLLPESSRGRGSLSNASRGAVLHTAAQVKDRIRATFGGRHLSYNDADHRQSKGLTRHILLKPDDVDLDVDCLDLANNC